MLFISITVVLNRLNDLISIDPFNTPPISYNYSINAICTFVHFHYKVTLFDVVTSCIRDSHIDFISKVFYLLFESNNIK